MSKKSLSLLFVLLVTCSALQLAPGGIATRAGAPRCARARAQFGKPERDGLTRDNEPDEFFSTNMDSMSDEEKFKSPVVIGGVAIIVVPFIVGMIALYAAQ